MAWHQKLGKHIVLSPHFRYAIQSAADFYYYRLDGTAIVPNFGRPRTQGPFYSSDFRLSALRSTTLGLKGIWNINDRVQLDAAYERYAMRGKDGVTPQSAYCRADIATFGIRLSW